MSKSLVEVLMERDNMSRKEAEERIEEVREIILASDDLDVERILAEELGLEPDYIFDLFN